MAIVVDPPRDLLNQQASATSGDILIQPIDFRFATQDADEEVYVVLRRSIITNFGWLSGVVFYMIVPILTVMILEVLDINVFAGLPVGYALMAPLIYYSTLLTYAIMRFNEWFFNLIIITNKRFVVYKFRPLSTFDASETDLDNILDVTQSTIGLFPSLFNYGDLLVQTASQRSKFRIKFVPRPTWVRNILVDLARMSKNPEP